MANCASAQMRRDRWIMSAVQEEECTLSWVREDVEVVHQV